MRTNLFVVVLGLSLFPVLLHAQGTQADYARADALRQRFSNRVIGERIEPHWFDDGSAFWYVRRAAGQPDRYQRVDIATGAKTLIEKPKVDFKKSVTPPRDSIRQKNAPRQTRSPDQKWEAFVRDHDLWLRGEGGTEHRLSHDGKAENAYDAHLFWSPSGKHAVAYRKKNGGHREVHLVESAPKDQLQPKHHTYFYLKPGDDIEQIQPVLFDLTALKPVPMDTALFDNPWSIGELRWHPDGSRFTYYYNQRGHQVARIIAVDVATGAARAVVDERAETFIDYSQKHFAWILDDTQELIWASERDGWNHLYLINLNTGKVKNTITTGAWLVRNVTDIDPEKRSLEFRCMGMDADQDPYHVHCARVNFDGTGLTRLTTGDGTHDIEYAPDGKTYLDRYSRVDLAPITELRRSADGALIAALEPANITALKAEGWRAPERFVAKGRDGMTDIHGVIFTPTNFDPQKQYPVIEHIYAGPHGHFVPKSFRTLYLESAIAELGFVVVKIDGMGTNWRSKAFHDVCWKNLGDSGFPDRIAWMRAAAAKRPWMDLSRVGIFGGSAGGQSAVRAMTEHGVFYKVAVADCGCHDNRMDKIWWNEAWMGWPIGPHYAQQSNVTHAHKITGDLLLIVGELDRNVDPSSTMQVVDALVKANRDFEMLVLPGAGHGAAETPYGKRRRADFFVRHLWQAEPRR